ncbi:alpha/beta hydrolase family protein [Arenibacter sp. M-2]|uniref:dienelactone hydrolase family protein n=1 Tax=Arenibacter sp. M-2 TaxID=3053612 RepID=UPI0025707019|nr:alpha/beta hydrolase family protein [Arenibacter sp. M-2]MDL5512535.1 alpha/beta hydrolase family protein [Arenibacter sp. M-2]
MDFRIKLLMSILLWMNCIGAYSQYEAIQDTDPLWDKIARNFLVPDAFMGDYGKYRSPLRFYNGKKVRTAKDWQKRKKEIRDRWQEMMGAWPEVITDQKLEILDTVKRENFVQHRVRFYWLPGERTEGYLLVPEGEGKKPAVVTVFYEPETAIGYSDKPHRDFAYQLVKRGFVALSIGTAEASKNKTFSLYYPNIDSARVQPLSMLGYAAANAWNVLSKVDKVDAARIGLLGHSFGGKWAMFGASLYDKFAASVWSDPGIVFEESRESVNYWEPWYLGYHPKPWRKRGLITKENPARGLYPKLVEQGYDLTELHALMAPRPFLVSGGSEDPGDRWKALNHTIAVNRLLGCEHRVAMTNRPEHSPNQESNEQIYLFLEYFLKPDIVHKK